MISILEVTKTRHGGLIQMDSAEEVMKVTGAKVKQAALQIKPDKSDVTGAFTTDAITNAPDVLFEQLASVYRSWLIHGTVSTLCLRVHSYLC